MDHHYLNLAYQLALENEGNTAPNPSVGAVVVKGDKIEGYGYHLKAGHPHAEAVAITQAGSRAEGATLYCSLEPCAHHGKTPPCVEQIAKAKISRVVFGALDRNPLVNGKGLAMLTERGIATEQIASPIIEDFYRPFFQTFETGRPFVYAKVGMTANGIISPADRNSRWITSELSLSWVHQLRAQCDAILVGADTVLLDRPHLTVRTEGVTRRPIRIVLDARFKLTPEECSLLESDVPILICGSETAPEGKESIWESHGVKTVRFRSPVSVLKNLFEMGIRKIMMEGGQKIFTLFHTAGLIDEYILIMAPRLLTGRHHLNFLAGPEQSLSEAERFHIDPPIELDGDVILRLRPRNMGEDATVQ
jgi:diaminohydroxyphosphoribosylaminopyrimidine deaminase / 5-amino-6-(5-phosphoribosylamino)uracil reductase